MDVSIPYIFSFSRFRKVRQKARKVIQSRENLSPEDNPPPEPEEQPEDRGKSSFRVWLFALVIIILLTGAAVISQMAFPSRTLSYEFLHGEANIITPEISYFRSKGDRQPFEINKAQIINTKNSLAIVEFPDTTIVQLNRNSRMKLVFFESGPQLMLLRGQFFVYGRREMKVEWENRVLEVIRATMMLEVRGKDLQVGILDGSATLEGTTLKSPQSYLIPPKGPATIGGTARLAQWVGKIPGITWPNPQVAVTNQTSNPKDKVDPSRTNPIDKGTPRVEKTPRRPAYPYKKASWRSRLESSLVGKSVTLEYEQVTLEALVQELGNLSGIKFNLDPSLPLDVRQKSLAEVSFSQQPVKKILQWLAKREPSLKFELDEQQVVVTQGDYSLHFGEREKIRLLFDYAREMKQIFRRKVVNIAEILPYKSVVVEIKKGTLAEAVAALEGVYPHSIQVEPSEAEKEVSLQGSFTLDQALQNLTSGNDLAYAPMSIGGDILVTYPAKARRLQRQYRRQLRIAREVKPEEENLRRGFYSTSITVELVNQPLWYAVQQISQISGVPIYLGSSAWKSAQRITLKGTFTLGQAMEKILGKTGYKIMAVNSYLFSKVRRHEHREVEVGRGLFVFPM